MVKSMKNTFALVSYVKHEKKKWKWKNESKTWNETTTKQKWEPPLLYSFWLKKIFLTERFNVPLFQYEFQHDFNDEWFHSYWAKSPLFNFIWHFTISFDTSQFNNFSFLDILMYFTSRDCFCVYHFLLNVSFLFRK